jgi:selenocysteine lyase/cysteine desulfurase
MCGDYVESGSRPQVGRPTTACDDPLVDDPRVAVVRSELPSAGLTTYVDHAAVGPISRSVHAAVAAVLDEHLSRGTQPRDAIDRVRGQVARLVGGSAGGVAFVQNTSFGLSLAANGIDWSPGDNVVLPEHEFPSNLYPWMNLARRGVDLRRVPAPDGHARLDAIAAAIDDRTRTLSVSAVQYSNGHRYDLAALGQLCRDRGVLFVVDGTQSVGALTIDVGASGVDVLAVSSHKWMLGPHGIGFAHCSDRALERLHPDIVGWLSVREPFAFAGRLDLLPNAERFEPGTENLLGIVGLGAAIGLVERLGPGWVEARVLAVTDHLCDRLPAVGCELITDREERSRSGIVVFRHRSVPNEVLYEQLMAAGVRCSARGGGIRFSPHCYNTVEEIDGALDVVRSTAARTETGRSSSP